MRIAGGVPTLQRAHKQKCWKNFCFCRAIKKTSATEEFPSEETARVKTAQISFFSAQKVSLICIRRGAAVCCGRLLGLTMQMHPFDLPQEALTAVCHAPQLRFFFTPVLCLLIALFSTFSFSLKKKPIHNSISKLYLFQKLLSCETLFAWYTSKFFSRKKTNRNEFFKSCWSIF